jgi:L-arabinose isomerase
MINLKEYEVWFITGSQHLYGEETLKKVAEHSQQIAKGLDSAKPKTVSASLPGCTPFRPPKCGLAG